MRTAPQSRSRPAPVEGAGPPPAPDGGHRTLPFRSVLAGGDGGFAPERGEVPDHFADLHLDEIVAAATVGRDAYDLEPFFRAPLVDTASIAYRHEVFRDLEDPAILAVARAFADGMREMRDRLGRQGKAHYRYEQERWFLDAVASYRAAVAGLHQGLAGAEPRSRALRGLRDHLERYLASAGYTAMDAEARRLEAELAAIRYRLRLAGDRIIVGPYADEPDYGAEVLASFEKFRQGSGEEYRFEFNLWPELNHIEAAILDLVARLFPSVFEALDTFATRHHEYVDPEIGRFDREVQFYLTWSEHIARLRAAGLPFCYPEVSQPASETIARDVFDLALARHLVDEGRPVVTNDVALTDPERLLVISGPNQGGKTTLSRAVGQLHHLAALGCPVPGTEVRLGLVDRVFTHFEREEEVDDLTGKLEDDLRRIREVLETATSHSLLIMNESFSSTTLQDQLAINLEILRRVQERGILCVAVTFLDELAGLPHAVSMVSTVDPDEPARRTFRIVRRPADGLAYALAIAEKHGLTFDRVKARIAR